MLQEEFLAAKTSEMSLKAGGEGFSPEEQQGRWSFLFEEVL